MTDYKTIAESNNFIVLDKYNKDWKVAESYQSEDALERELIEDLQNQGYEYLPVKILRFLKKQIKIFKF